MRIAVSLCVSLSIFPSNRPLRLVGASLQPHSSWISRLALLGSERGGGTDGVT